MNWEISLINSMFCLRELRDFKATEYKACWWCHSLENSTSLGKFLVILLGCCQKSERKCPVSIFMKWTVQKENVRIRLWKFPYDGLQVRPRCLKKVQPNWVLHTAILCEFEILVTQCSDSMQWVNAVSQCSDSNWPCSYANFLEDKDLEVPGLPRIIIFAFGIASNILFNSFLVRVFKKFKIGLQ